MLNPASRVESRVTDGPAKVEENVTESQYQELSKKLDLLTRLMALSLIADKQQQDQITLLSKAGFQPKEIAEIIGTTANTVSVVLSKRRRKKARGK